MSIDDDTPLTDEERALAEWGARIVAAAVADSEAAAPASLREAIERQRASAAAAPARRRGWFGLARGHLVAAGSGLVAVAIALVFAFGGDNAGNLGSGPSVVQVAAVTRQPATQPAPAAVPVAPPAFARLDAEVEGLPFPDWKAKFNWETTGRRTDSVRGRRVTTVYYRNRKGATLGYALVAGGPIDGAPAGTDVVRAGTTYRVARAGGRTTVTWTQAGHTCVIDAPSAVSDAKLIELAAWANA